MQLPPDIRAALEEITGKSPLSALKNAAAIISARYRGKARVDAGIRNADEARAYLGVRFPATYAAARYALAQIAGARPDFDPRSLLDIGAGPGTVAIAALSLWPGLEKIKLLEPNPYLKQAGQELFESLGHAGKIEWINTVIETADLIPYTSDLVTSGYVLNEIRDEKGVEQLIEKIWQTSLGTLLVLEPGTPEGYAIILRIRDKLLSCGAHMIAPCPHTATCPLAGQSWCHFSARVDRSRLHRILKDGASLSYEDEKFSYVSFSRQERVLPSHRVIGYPSGTKIVQLQLCNGDGSATTTRIPKSHPHHKLCRKLEWGDEVGVSLTPPLPSGEA